LLTHDIVYELLYQNTIYLIINVFSIGVDWKQSRQRYFDSFKIDDHSYTFWNQ